MLLVHESGALTKPPLLARDVQLYHLAEYLTEFLIYFMLVFSPWAFGTTEPWSIWVMNVCGYGLGLLLLIKMTVRWTKGYRPARWAEHAQAGHLLQALRPYLLTRALAVLTLGILSYCLVAAVNARATFNPLSLTFDYHDCVTWLPRSFDSHGTWEAFWRYVAAACWFWALRDWLLGKSAAEQAAQSVTPALPIRLERVLWVLAINGGFLGLEGIIQRLSDSPKLLFLVKPEIHQSAQTQFASYAYRANGAQYFNLLWPVCLAFWWRTQRSKSLKPIAKRLLLAGTVIMASCPIISSARGAALVDLSMMLAAALLLLVPLFFFKDRYPGKNKARSAGWVVLFLAGTLAAGLGLGWKQLRPRMDDFTTGLKEREQLYDRARVIAGDYPVFGTGPGSFERVFQLYRGSPATYWPAQLHNDWLETRVTFGWLGSGLIAIALFTVLLRGFVSGGIRAGNHIIILTWLSLTGCLVQARWDFPMQVYSILLLFLVGCAVLFTVCRTP